MTRYYYDCPIKAAYMAEYFGVEMSYLFCNADSWQEYKSTERMGAFEIEKYFDESRATLCDRIWISDEWNDFFEPKNNDLAQFTRDDGISTIAQYDEVKKAFINGNFRILKKYNPKIIMRNGKQFFMPEVEND